VRKLGKGKQFWVRSLVIGIGLVIGIWSLGFVVGCGQGVQNVVEEGETVQGLVISPEAVTLMVGETQRFRISGLVKGLSTTLEAISWLVTGGIGTIDAEGLFTATATGEGTVEARVDSLVGRAKVRVVAAGPVKTISGKVTDMISGKPIAGVVVYAGGKTAVTDSNGDYSFVGVPASVESVTVKASGYTPVTIFSQKGKLDIETSLDPRWPEVGYYVGSNTYISGEVRDVNGSPLDVKVKLMHRYYYASALSNSGKYTMSTFIDPEKIPMEAYLSAASSTIAGIKKIEITSTGSVDAGILTLEAGMATISGRVVAPFSSEWGGVGWGIKDSAGRYYCYPYEYSGWGDNYSLNVPPTPQLIIYFIRAYKYTDNGHVVKYVEDIQVASSETKTVDVTVPGLITLESPADRTASVGVNPVLRWTPPDSKFNLYLVYLFEGGASSVIKWVGVTDKASLTYPTFATGSGFEDLNLVPGREYFWKVFGYYIPGFSLSSSSVKLFSLLKNSAPGIRSFGSGSVSAFSVGEINQALEETVSEKTFSFRP